MFDFLSHVIASGEIHRLFPPVASVSRGVPLELFSAHATTIVGVCAKNAVVVCADSQATNAQNLNRWREPIHKLFVAGEYGAVGIAGAAGPAQKSARLFQIAASAEECLASAPLSSEKYGLMLQTIASQLLPLALSTDGQLAVLFLLGCYDVASKEGRLFTADPSGTLMEHRETGYAAIGSGADPAQDWLDSLPYRAEQSSVNEALDAGIKALLQASKRNAATGKPFFAVTITSQGAAEVSCEKIDALINGASTAKGARGNHGR